DPSALERLTRRVAPAQKHHFFGEPLTAQARHHLRAQDDRYAADHRTGLAELRVLARHRQIAGQVELVAARDTVAADARDHAHRQAPQAGDDRDEQLQERAAALRIQIAHLGHVAARTEGALARAGQHHRGQAALGADPSDCIGELLERSPAQCIEHIGPIERDPDRVAPTLVENVRVIHQPTMVSPPLTDRIWPVMYDARADARNEITSAISSGRPERRMGMVATTASSHLGPRGLRRKLSSRAVSVRPGQTQLTATPRRALSRARGLVSAITPPLAAE